MAVNDLFEVTIKAELQGQPLLNIYHMFQEVDSAIEPELEATALLTGFSLAIANSQLAAIQTQELRYVEGVAQNLGNLTVAPPPPVGPPVKITFDEPGAAVGTALPATDCILLRRVPSSIPPATPLPGKLDYILGRNFFSGLTIDFAADGLLAQGAVLAAEDWVLSLMTGIDSPAASAVWRLVNYSRNRHKLNQPTYWEFPQSVQAAPWVHSLRPRRGGTSRGGL